MTKIVKKYIAEFVYGAIDGTITTFAIVSGVVGAGLNPGIILVLGISNVLADGFSMASSNYLSEKSDCQMTDSCDDVQPHKTALMTFVSFISVGSIPLLPFLFSYIFGWFGENQFLESIIFTSVAFILVGVIRGKISGQNKFKTALETFVVGAIAASVAYGVGYLLQGLV